MLDNSKTTFGSDISSSDVTASEITPNKGELDSTPAEKSERSDHDFSCPIVGIGASAGGLEALEDFFREVSTNTHVAFVVVQHLSPDFPSMMDELLARVTSIPISVIANAMRIEPGQIYLLPANQEVVCAGGRLILSERSPNRELSYPIDQFLRSLADDAGDRAIAVILSGTGTDGARGIVHIHDNGGVVISQEPSSAKFDGMPRAAYDTGVVDLVAVPSNMPSAISNYTLNPVSTRTLASPLHQSPRMEGPIYTALHLLKAHCGVDFTDYKTTTIGRRIQRRALLSHHPDLDVYVEALKKDPSEVKRLYQDLLIGVTSFFRDQEVFAQLEEKVIPKLMEGLGPLDEFRAWTAGCASGEEAYTIAILIHEYLERTGESRPAKVFATDVHEGSLQTASRGVYQEESLSRLTPERRERYFIHRSDGFHVSGELRKMVVCVPHNMIRDAPFTRIDLVTCRNALIYFTPHAQNKALALLHFALKRHGVLCLGPSETLSELENEFSTIDEKAKIYRKSRDIPVPVVTGTPNVPSKLDMSRAIPMTKQSAGTRDLFQAYDAVLNTFMPAGFLVAGNRDLIHVFEGGSRFLQAKDGRVSNDVLDHIHHDLRTTLATALRRHYELGQRAIYENIACEFEGEERPIRLTVRRLKTAIEAEELFFVQFEVQSKDVATAPAVDTRDASGANNDAVVEMEQELELARDSLQSTIEQFQTTNEELQATNEQLIASNEELQSTNEELHSVNEELYTVNAEHQRKIEELTELTADMDNLLATTNVHTVFLDRELRIRRFTPGIAAAFNLIPQDVGRRIDSFTYNLVDADLLEEIEQVLHSESPFEREVCNRTDQWYLMRILPYRSGRRVDGVVLTLIDITKLKAAERRLAELSEIVEHSDDAIIRLANDGIITTWNAGAEKLFGFRSTDVVGQSVSMLVPDDLRDESEVIFYQTIEGGAVDRFETKRRCSDGSDLDVALTLSPIRNESGDVVGASEIIRDVTARKVAEQEVRNAVQNRDRFLAVLSHELRNPMAAVLNATAVLHEPAIEQDLSTEAKGIIDQNVRHVSRLLDDLLDLSRFTHNKILLNRQVLDLNAMVNEVVGCVRPLIREKDQEFVVQTESTSICVDGDPDRIRQAQINLLVNAAKYTPPDGKIIYSLRSDGDEVVIGVEDDGIGMSADFLEHIFEPFMQSEQSLDRSQGGMGLGLPLVKMIVEAHGGRITVNSDGNGKGSEFIVRLPRTNLRPIPARSPRVDLNEGRRIVVVEDNAGIRKMLRASLELKGFEVKTACNGRDGFEAVTDFAPDVALLDVGLPDITGYELARMIREQPKLDDVLLVAVTGYGRESDQAKAMEAGFDVHLVKPIRVDELLSSISKERVAD